MGKSTADYVPDVLVPSEERIKQDLQHIKEWISKEPHLPLVDDDEWLTTFLFQTKFSLEKTKLKLDAYYTVRSLYPEFLKNRDPSSLELHQSRKARPVGVSTKTTKDGSLVIMIRLSPNPKIYNTLNETKRYTMIMDVLLLEKHRLNGYIILMDCENLSYHHFLKAISIAKPLSDISNASPTRVKGIHFINAPSIIDKFVELIRLSFSEKIGDRVYTYTKENSDLQDVIDRDILCKDFGGHGPNFSEYEDHCQQLLEKHKEWFKAQDNVCSNEALRRADDKRLEAMRGSFRKLEVD